MKKFVFKKGHKSKEGGLTEAGREAYNKETGSDLKPPVTSEDPSESEQKRRDSFCARSKGQQEMHDIDCKKEPKRRLCLARKRWKC